MHARNVSIYKKNREVKWVCFFTYLNGDNDDGDVGAAEQ